MSAPTLDRASRVNRLPDELDELDRTLPLAIRMGTFTASLGNSLLAEISERDIGLAGLAYRKMAGGLRLAMFGTHEQQHLYARHGLTAVAIDPAKTTATRIDAGSLRVQAPLLMATGAHYCHSVLVQADVDGAATALLLPASAIRRIVAPSMRGLASGDNCFADLDVEVDERQATLGGKGNADVVVEAPYTFGLTLGALYLGGIRRSWAAMSGLDVPITQRHRIGEVYAEVLALEALVVAASEAAPDAGAVSRAAKVLGAKVGEHVVYLQRRLSGSRAYGLSHEVNALDADLEGLRHQAPGHDGALDHLARIGTARSHKKEAS